MPVLHELRPQQLSSCCSVHRGAQRLPQGCSRSTPRAWANKPNELLGRSWQRADPIPSPIKKAQIPANLKETLFLAECVGVVENMPSMLPTVIWCKQGKGCLQEACASLETELRARCRAAAPARSIGAASTARKAPVVCPATEPAYSCWFGPEKYTQFSGSSYSIG